MGSKISIQEVEGFVIETFKKADGVLTLAHDFTHVNKVRNAALEIAGREGFSELEKLETAALLHDVGLTTIPEDTPRNEHGRIGAAIAEKYLRQHSEFTETDIEQITDAITYHSLQPWVVQEHLETLEEGRVLIEILRDADLLDGLGASGVMRACSSKYFLPGYDPENLKGDLWGLTREERIKQFGDIHPPVTTIVEQIDQQIRSFDNLHTESAKMLAVPLVRYMKDFVLQLESETNYT